MTTTIKITELTNIGANLASSTVIPVVNMAGTPTTEKTVLGNIANVVLAGAGGNYVAAAKATTATTANTILTNAQPNITSIGSLIGLTVSNATGVVNFSNTANVTLGNVSNLHIAGGTIGQILSTDGAGNLSWASDTTTYGNSNVVSLLGAFGSNTITTTGNISVGNITATNLGNVSIINRDGNSSNVLYGNGVFAPVTGGGSANIGNVTFDDNIVIGTGSNDGSSGLYLAPGNASIASSAVQYLRVRGGDAPTHIHLDTGNNAYYDQYFGDDGKYVKLANAGNIVINSDDSIGNSAQWNFGVDGYLTVPGPITSPVDDTLTLVTSGSNGNSSSIGIDGEFGRTLLRTYDGTTLNTWEFDITGNLDLPVGGDLNFNGGGITQAINQELNIVVQDEEDDGWSIFNTITDGLGNNLSQTQLDSGSFTIGTASGGNTYSWSFEGNTLQVSSDSQIRSFGSNVVVQSMSSGSGGTASLQSVSNTNDPNIFTTFDATTTGANIKVYDGGSNGGVGYTWQFANDGRLTFPGTPRIDTDANNFEVQAAEAINFEANTVVNIYTDTGNSAYQWQFGDDGNLTVPGNLIGPAGANFTIYSNAAVHEFIFADDGTFYAPDDAVLGGNAIYIGPGANTLSGIEHEVLLASSNHFAYVQGVVNNISDNGSAEWVALGAKGGDIGGWGEIGFTSSGFGDANYTITGAGDGYVFAQSYAPGQTLLGGGGNLVLATGNNGTTKDIIFGTGGFLTSNIFGRISHANNSLELSRTGATITFPDATEQNTAWTGSVTTIANGNSNVNIATANGNIVITSAGTESWTFDTTGNLTLSGTSGGMIKTQANGFIGITAINGGSDNPAQMMSWTVGETNPNTIISTYSTNALIQSNVNGTIKTWQFDDEGNLTLPTGGQIIVSGGLISSGASPAPTFSGFNITNHVGVTGTGNISGNNISITGNISGNTNGFTIGYLNIPQVSASNTTIGLTDAGKHYYSTTAGNFTLTVPNNSTTSFATGTAISIVVQAAGNILVNAASGVTLYMAGNSTAANRIVGGYGMATLMKVGTDTWFINGTGVS